MVLLFSSSHEVETIMLVYTMNMYICSEINEKILPDSKQMEY